MFYTLKINGVVYECSKISYKRMASLDSNVLDATMIIAGSRTPNFNDPVVLTKEVLGTTITKFTGTVQQIFYLPSKKGQIRIIAYDKNRKITYLNVMNLGYAATKGSTIVSTEIGPSSATTDLTAGSIDTSDSAIDTVNFGKTINGTDSALTRQDALEAVAMISNRDIYIHRDGTTDFKNPAGTDRSNTIVLIDGINGELTGDFGYFTDNSKIVKQVIVKGKGTGVLNAVIGSAGTPASTDKVRQFEMPFLVSAATCNSVASNLLTELNKTTQYAKFKLTDILTVDYDVFDTVKLKAKLINNNVNVNLKIYSIDVTINIDQQEHEIVTLELLNFNRAIFAPLIIPTMAAGANQKNLSLSTRSTQASDQIGLSGGSSVVLGASAGAGVKTVISGSGYSNLIGYAMDPVDVAGAHFWIPVQAIVHLTGQNQLLFRIFDGSSIYYPAEFSPEFLDYDDNVGKKSRGTIHIFIPANVNGKTLTLQASIASATSEVEIEIWPTYYTIARHNH